MVRVLIAAGACALGMAATAHAAVYEWRYDAVLPLVFDEGEYGPYPDTENFSGIVRLDVPSPFNLSIFCEPNDTADPFSACDELLFAGISGPPDLSAGSDFSVISSNFSFSTDGNGRVLDVDALFGGDPEYALLGLDSLTAGFDRGGPVYSGGGGEWILTNPLAAIPLPATAPLVLIGLAGLGWITRKSA